jgi:hypothetical protein
VTNRSHSFVIGSSLPKANMNGHVDSHGAAVSGDHVDREKAEERRCFGFVTEEKHSPTSIAKRQLVTNNR